MMDDFALFRRAAQKRYDIQREERVTLRGGDSDQKSNDEEIEYTVQFLVETKKEEVAE